MGARIFVGWDNGVFVNSLDPQFQQTLVELIDLYGPPSVVEFRECS